MFNVRKKLFRMDRTYRSVMLVAVLAVGLCTLVISQLQSTDAPILVAVDLNIQALDSSGRAVPGVRVRLNGADMGRTDAFGGWSRFSKFPTGSTIEIELVKTDRYRNLRSVRTFAVPDSPPVNQQILLGGHIALETVTELSQGDAETPQKI